MILALLQGVVLLTVRVYGMVRRAFIYVLIKCMPLFCVIMLLGSLVILTNISVACFDHDLWEVLVGVLGHFLPLRRVS